MSIKRALLFSRFEFNRFLFSKRGIVALVAYLLTWGILLTEVISRSAEALRGSNFSDAIRQILGEVGFSKIIEWSVPELVFYWVVAIFSFPLLAVFASADQLCSDKARGTMRFLSLRSTRAEILLGRFVGQIFISASFILLSLFAVLILIAYKGESSMSVSFALSTKIFFQLLIMVIPVIAFMTLINTFSTSSKQTIVYFFLIVLVTYLIVGLTEAYLFTGATYALYALPNVNWTERMQLGLSMFEMWIVPLIQMAVFLTLARVQFARRAI